MGREIKRVPIGFDWPINETWSGFLMPDRLHETRCAACDRSGTTPARQWVEQITALLLLLDDDLNAQRQGRPMHPYFNHTGSRAHAGRPSPDIAEFGEGLAGRAMSFMGHDSIDNWQATSKIIEAAGLDPKAWGLCPACEGHGSIEVYPGQRAEADEWVPDEPPTGEAWQVWETVSEGSPISPVFATRDGLIGWLMSPAYCMGISSPLSRAQAESFVGSGWAVSMVSTPETGVIPGEQWVQA